MLISESVKSRPSLLILLVLIIGVLTSPAFAAGEAVRGTVRDGEGEPIPSATVRLFDAGQETQVATTGADGRFEIVDVAAGTYQVEAALRGYTVETVAVVVVEGQAAELMISLTSAPTAVKEIVVFAKASILRDEPVSAVSLDRTQIMALPHFGDDLMRAVTALPGTSSGDYSSRFTVRGGLHDEVLVRLDNFELFEPFHLKDFQGVFSILDPELVTGVDLLPGSFPAMYGDRMTAVLDMSTRRPSATRTGIGISFSNAWVTSFGVFADGKGCWLGSLRRGYLDVVLDFVEDDDDGDDPPDPRYWDSFAKVSYDFSPGNSLAIKALFADDDLLYHEDEEDDDELTDVNTGYDSRYLWLSHTAVIGSRSFVDTILSAGRVGNDRNMTAVETDESIALADERSVDIYTLQQDWQHELSDRHYVRWGVMARHYAAEYDYFNSLVLDDPVDDPRFPPGIQTTSYQDSFSGQHYAAYISDRLGLLKGLTAEIGLRFDSQTLLDDSQTSPRLNFAYDLGRGGLLRLGWGHFYQSQRPHELGVPYGETEFYPAQRADHLNLGYEASFENIRFRLDAYRRQVSDPHPYWQTLFDPFHPAPEAATDLVRIAPERVTAEGIEVYLASPSERRFSWWFGYALSSIDDRIDGVDMPRSIDQTHAITASASWRPNSRWNITGLWTYHTGWPTTAVTAEAIPIPGNDYRIAFTVEPFNQERLSDYNRFDIRISRSAPVGRGELVFFIDIQNLLDRDNPRGFDIQDAEYNFGSDYQVTVTFPEENWLPMVPSVGFSWEF